MKNTFEITLMVETDNDGLTQVKIKSIKEVVKYERGYEKENQAQD